ncbi:MAG: Ig-like domain-containing protein [Lachnospiraceae bacterium]|nr:Ig-like domain-containing protein [Lachnospiraceae bacterium]
MNTLSVKLNPYKNINTVSLDDRPLSPYSELNNFMREPFLKWAGELLEAAEREINDDFCLEITAGAFETMFLDGMSKGFEPCRDYRTKSFSIDTPAADRLADIEKIASKLGVTVDEKRFAIPVYSETDVSLPFAYVRAAGIEEAFLIISENADITERIGRLGGESITLLINGSNRVSSIGGSKYLWETDSGSLDKIIGSIIDRFVKTPMITYYSERLEDGRDSLEEREKRELALSVEIDAFMYIEDPPEIEVDETVDLEIHMVPKNAEAPRIRLVSQNESIVVTEGLSITAVAPGETFIEIYRDQENVPFDRKKVLAYQNNVVQKIRLYVTDKQMCIGHSQQVGIELMPPDAEDAGEIRWSVDNSNIIRVDQNGVITAVNEGIATVTATAREVGKRIKVEVLPNIKRITVVPALCDVTIATPKKITVSIEPENCANKSYSWVSSDESIAVVETNAAGEQAIKGKRAGDCTITFKADEGDCQTKCAVHVASTLYDPSHSHGMLSLTTVFTLACILCAALSFTTVCAVLAAGAVIFGIIAMVKNKSDIFWALILMIAAVLTALEATGITNFI